MTPRLSLLMLTTPLMTQTQFKRMPTSSLTSRVSFPLPFTLTTSTSTSTGTATISTTKISQLIKTSIPSSTTSKNGMSQLMLQTAPTISTLEAIQVLTTPDQPMLA